MTKSKFLQMLSKKSYTNITISSGSRDRDARAISKMIGTTVNFDCGFKDGTCKKRHPIGAKKTEMCCCSNCKYETGYLRRISFKDLGTVAKAWDEKTGFWRKDTGCQLPHELRSVTCIFYNCSEDLTVREGLHAVRTLLLNAESRRGSDRY